ncbi:MAG: hypothetical protein JJT78_00065 [Leptospira sp.]|nr:hypothetical protein [Leptospira sp.]
MGINVDLYIDRTKVKESSWKEFYKELDFLWNNFSIPLGRLSSVKRNNIDIFILSSEISGEKSKSQELNNFFLEINGDLISNKLGESYIVNYDFIKNTGDGTNNLDQDFLYIDPKDEDFPYISPNWTNLFGNKTQGFPFHLAVVSAGILAEDHFPDYCFLSHCNMRKKEIIILKDYISNTFNRNINLPISMDEERLFTRLRKIYNDDKILLKYLFTNCELENSEILSFLENRISLDSIIDFLAGNILEFSSLNTRGCSSYFQDILESNLGLEFLLKVFQKVNILKSKFPEGENDSDDSIKNQSFDPLELFEILAHHHITIPLEERFFSGKLFKLDENLQSIDQLIGLTFGSMSISNVYDVYIPREKYIDLFHNFFSLKPEILNGILEKIEAELKEKYSPLWEHSEKMKNSVDKWKQEENESLEDYLKENPKNLSSEEKYIIKQAIIQKDKIFRNGDFDYIFNLIKRELEKEQNSTEESNLLKHFPKSHLELRSRIYFFLEKFHYNIHEKSIFQIDIENNINYLNFLLFLTAFPSDMPEIKKSIEEIINNPKYWMEFKII